MATKLYISVVLFAFTFFQPASFGQNYEPCLEYKRFKVVVIGSSTAAGAGVSSSDSAWVNRYRKELQSINTKNEVINLAQGGYHTYALMPNSFVPPLNRPEPDTNRNITKALSLNPDAIIINLPSNDNSRGYLMEEQLDNFDSIVNYSRSGGVPIWICTTQPKNYGEQVKMDTQRIVRDSIFHRYGDFALDFWSEIGDSLGRIKTEYDSGDGTHLNDAGHRILNERVVEKNIPIRLLEMQEGVDYGIEEIFQSEPFLCQGSEIELGIVYANSGLQDTQGMQANLHLEHCLDNGLTALGPLNIVSHGVCVLDTIYTTFDADFSDCAFVIQLAQPSGYVQDDKLRAGLSLFESPEILATDTFSCGPASFELIPEINLADSISWSNASDVNFLLGTGAVFNTPLLDSSTTYLVSAFKRIEKNGNLETALETNRDWNGIMTDVYARQKVMIDSIYMRFSTPGLQVLQISIKPNSILGFEQDSAAWQAFFMDSVMVDSTQLFHWIDIPPLIIEKGDTVGMYFEMENLNARLAYFAESHNQVFENSELVVTNGTGISKGFGATYFPRSFLGAFDYQVLFEPNAFCSVMEEINVIISEPSIDLGPDLNIGYSDTIYLTVNGIYESYIWSDGSTGDSLEIIGNNIPSGAQEYILTVFDEYGCSATDTILISSTTVQVNDQERFMLHDTYSLGPNPCTEGFNLNSWNNVGEIVGLEVLNHLGQSLLITALELPGYVDCSHLSVGHYWIKIIGNKGTQMIALMKAK